MNTGQFESFKRADVYAFGLVLWEMCRRTNSTITADEFQLPYYDMVPADPSVDDMKRVVATEQRRPASNPAWLNNHVTTPHIYSSFALSDYLNQAKFYYLARFLAKLFYPNFDSTFK